MQNCFGRSQTALGYKGTVKILVTGAGGMLGHDLTRQESFDVVGLSHAELDILDGRAVRSVIHRHEPNFVINCAAFTNVDACEDNEVAFRVNAIGPGMLAEACKEVGAWTVQISTDYVFDGNSREPYTEADTPNPINAYGRAKFAGELAVEKGNPERFLIVRSAWLFGPRRKCFPATILQLAKEGKPIRVVADQVGSPTYTPELAGAILNLLGFEPPKGIYHLVNGGQATWFEFAEETLKAAGIEADVKPISTDEWQSPASRPSYSVLACEKVEAAGLAQLRDWHDAVREYVGR